MKNKKQKKIGIDVRLWNETGIGRYIRNLVINVLASQSDFEFVLFAKPQDVHLINRETVKSKQLFQIVETRITWHSIEEQILFPNLLIKYNLDLMHFPYFSVPVFYKRPFIVTVHDLIINFFPTGRASTLPTPIYSMKRFGYSVVLKTALKHSKKIITPTVATKQEIKKLYGISDSKIEVTLEGVDLEISDFKPVVFKDKNPYILYVGNAYPHKNLEGLVKAFQIFSKKNPEYTLKLVGKEDFFYKRLKKMVGKNDIQNIEFLGFIADDVLGGMYKNASVVVVPSFMEGFGLTALEAMKMGGVVAVSNIPSLVEVCKEAAFYFDPHDSLSIARTLDDVVSLPQSKRLERIKVSKNHANIYSWEKMAQLTLDVYNSCL